MTSKNYLFLILSLIFCCQNMTFAEESNEVEAIKKQIELLTDTIPDKPGPNATDEDFDNWRKQNYTIRQKRIEAIEKLELLGLPEEQLKSYYVMKLDDIESCFYYARLGEANKFEGKLYTMMDDSTPTGKMLSNELFWQLNIYHINTHLMHISEADLQQIADFELSRKESSEAGRLLAQAINKARPDYTSKIKWSTWITDNMPPESEGYKLISSLNRRKSDIGKPFTFESTDLLGKTVTEKDFKGNVLLVDYWALWCGICLQEVPKIKQLQEKYQDKGFRVLGIFNDHRIDELKSYIKENEISWPQLIPPKVTKNDFMHPLTKRYAISGFPTYLLIDREGKLVRLAGRVEHLEPDIERLLSEKKD